MTNKQNKRNANNALSELSKVYHNSIPLADIDGILTANGFNALEPAIYCGREGRSHESVGNGVFISLTWYKMELTGRYEVVAYVS